MLYVVLYLLGLFLALHRYGTRTDFKGTDALWRVGRMVVLWPVAFLGEIARWWGRRVS